MPKDKTSRHTQTSIRALRRELPLGEQAAMAAMDSLLTGMLALSFSVMVFILLGLEVNHYFILPSLAIALVLILIIYRFFKYILIGSAVLIVLQVLFTSEPIQTFLAFAARTINRIVIVLEPSFYRYLFADLSNTEFELLRQETTPLFSFFVIFLLASLSFLIVYRFRMPILATTLLVALVVTSTYFTRPEANIWALWGLLSVVPVFFLAAAGTSDVVPTRLFQQYLKATLSGLLSGTILLVPAWLLAQRYDPRDVYSRSAQGFVDDISTFLPDEIRPRRRFDPFSINRSGYYPREELLGGSVTLSPNPVFRLRGSASGLLKGQTSLTYTGESWIRETREDTWRFDSPIFSEKEREVFSYDEDLFADLGIISALPEESDYSIEMLQSGITVLFTNGLAKDLTYGSSNQMQAFFNEDGILYAQYPLNAGQTYSLETVKPPVDLIRERSLFLYENDPESFNVFYGPNANGTFSSPTGNFDAYLQLPEDETFEEGGFVYETTLDWAEGDEPFDSPQDRLSKLYRLVARHKEMTYSLQMPIPPEGQDFVEHVIEVEAGYCVYFATSLTVMARILGIPARYVEGYGIPGGAERFLNSTGFVIRGEQAHAWTEVYLEGLGWIPLDPTPGGVAGGETDLPDASGDNGGPVVPSITEIPEPGDNGSPLPTISPDVIDGRPGITDIISWPYIITLALLVVALAILWSLGLFHRMKTRFQLGRPNLAIRYIGKGVQHKDSDARGGIRWTFPDKEAIRNLYLMYWQEIRLELRMAKTASIRAVRRAEAIKKRKLRKLGPDYKEPERDFYKAKVQSAYKPSPFVEFLNEEAAKKRERDRLFEEERVIYENKPKKAKTLLDRWADPSLIGTWRRELDQTIEELPLLKKEKAPLTENKSLTELLEEAERIAERAAFAGPDYHPTAEDIYRIHIIYRRIRYLRRHWPLPDLK